MGAEASDDGDLAERAFRLNLDADQHRWSGPAPEHVVRQVTAEQILAWEKDYFAPEKRPAALAELAMRIVRQPVDAGAWIFEFHEVDECFDPREPVGIRVWEPQEGVSEEDLQTQVKQLGNDVAKPADADAGTERKDFANERDELEKDADPPEKNPQKKWLRADDDDDDF